MNYRLLLIVFFINTSFCFLPTTIHAQDFSNDINATQQNSVITIDVQSTVDQDAFFKSLIKDIKSDRVEYKDGKIFIYIKPPLAPILENSFCAMATAIGSILGLAMVYFFYTENKFFLSMAFVFWSIGIMIAEGISLYFLYNKLKHWLEKNPLITLETNGIRFRNGHLVLWNDIKDIVQNDGLKNAGVFSNLTITSESLEGSKVFTVWENSNLPITFNEMTELIYQVFYHNKQVKQ